MNYTDLYKNDVQQAMHSLDYHALFGSTFLITGATGLVCSNIVDTLLTLNDTYHSGIKVYAAVRSFRKAESRFKPLLPRKDLIMVEYDAATEPCPESKVDYIIHGAGSANPYLYSHRPADVMLAHLEGMIGVLEYARKNPETTVLFLSSSEVYGIGQQTEGFRENDYGSIDPLKPRACYSSAKHANETLCISYLSQYGTNVKIARLGHVYGPTASIEDTRISSRFFFDVLEGKDIILKSSGNQRRSYCYVPDSTSALLTILIKGEKGEVYNVANASSNVTIREFSEILAQTAGCRIVFDHPLEAEIKSFNVMNNSCLNAGKLLSLGWAPQFNVQQGIQHTYSIMKG